MTDGKTLIVPGCLIVVGTGWLLTNLGIVPGIDWVWTLGLLAIGLITFAVAGVDKLTVVVGPFFVAASCLSFLRQASILTLDVELPILVIWLGVLLLIIRSPAIPVPGWMQESEPAAPTPQG